MTPQPLPLSRPDGADDPDDPIALPLPPHTVLLDAWPPEATAQPFTGTAVDLVMRAVQQQQQDLGLNLSLALSDSEVEPEATTAPQEEHQALLTIEGFRVQLVCSPFWADSLAVPASAWGRAAQAPHLLLAAWVDPRCGAIAVPGVLTAAEARAALPGLERGEGLETLPVTALQGGLDRLFALLRLLEPAALALPQRNPSRTGGLLPLLPWLEGHLGAALAPFAPQWLPAEAHAFRSGLAAAGAEVLVAVAIPLALVAGRVRWGGERRGGSERFQLRLSLCGHNGRAERLEVMLEPCLAGDLLPQHLALVVGDQRLEYDSQADRGPRMLSAPAGDERIAIRLERQGVTELQLPPMILATPSPNA